MAALNARTAARIRGLMAEQKKSTAGLAGHLGISRQAAAKKVQGHTGLSVDDLEQIAGWLGVESKDLIP